MLSFVLLTSIVNAQFPAPYCAEAYGSSVEPITSVVLNTINNSSSATVGGTAHEDYTAISTNLTVGGSYSISVKGNTDGPYMDYIRVFIDWNQNGDFADAGESFDVGIINSSTGADGKTVTTNIIVPASATLGSTRMRVAKKWNGYQTPCNTLGYGESEDYTLVIIASSACTGTPLAGTATAPMQACSGNSFILNLSGASVATGIHYQWQTTTIGGSAWANILNDTTSSISVLQGAVGADYRCVITCTNSSISVNTNAVSVAVQTTNCPPPNDDICSAITLVLDGTADCQNTANATSVGDPTSFTCSTPNNTTWYKYTPTSTGSVLFSLSTPAIGDPLNGWLGVYTVTGTCPGALTFTDVTTTVLGACKSYGSTAGSMTSFLANLTASTEYYFMVDGVGGDTGSYCISMLTPPTPPASCATNILPANAATSVASTPAVVLRWTAVAGATSYDVYHGTANPPTTLIKNTTTDSALITGTAFNTTYNWYVVPRNGGGTATGCDANITSYTTGGAPASAANDDPCDAITLILDGATDCKNSTYATSVGDPASFTCSTPNNTLWYKYTPATSGNVQFTFAPPASGDTLFGWLGVFTTSGTCPGTLTFTDVTSATLGACKSFGAVGNTSTVFSANLTGGTEYYFMIDGVSGDVGQYCVSIQTPPPAPTTCATNISPANSAIDVAAPAATIRWSSVAGATSYDVYFGTANPPTTLAGNTTLDSTQITGLAFSTVYYWYVAPKNGGGIATGCDANLTSFTTITPPPAPVNDNPCDAISLILDGPSDCQSTVSATSTNDPTSFSCSTPNNTTWYKYTAITTDSVQFTITSPSTGQLNGWLGIYTATGTCPGALTFTDVTSSVASCQSYGGVPSTTTKIWTRLVAGTDYYFMIDGVSGAVGSYCVSMQSKQTLPVTITKFIGERKGTTNLLSWTTATETNNKGFELQRSATGINFLTTTFAESKAIYGNSTSVLNYQVIDTKPYSGITYYRLKQIDKNGKSAYSSIIAIKGEKATSLTISEVYPNPAINVLNIIVASPSEEKTNIIITDITGKILQKQAVLINSGNNNIQLNLNNLATGSYMLKVLCNNGCSSSTFKFVKE